MSMPSFPEIDPAITCDYALNMILTSIAMEELALSHIINAEGEKLQYVLNKLDAGCGKKPDISEILKVNQSVANLLDSVSQNQIILKNKMDKALAALLELCPKPLCPQPYCNDYDSCCECGGGCRCGGGCECCGECTCSNDCGGGCRCRGECSALFKEEQKRKLWYPGCALHWSTELHGKCASLNKKDKTKIDITAKGRLAVNFAVNVCGKGRGSVAAVTLQKEEKHRCVDISTVHSPALHDGKLVTLSMGGIIVDNCGPDCFLTLKLKSHDPLTAEDAMLSIFHID